MQETNPRKFEIRLPLLLALAMAVGMFIGTQLPHSDQSFFFSKRPANGVDAGTFEEVLRFIQAKYVDTVDVENIKTEALDNLLASLDPHSVYITPDELDAVEEDMEGEFQGIGVEFLIVKDTIQVITPLSGGPSEAAGILALDKVIFIGDTLVAGVHINNGRIYQLLRGDKGTQVKVGILRGKEKTIRWFNIVRDIIPVHSVDAAMMLDERVGYIKVNRFSEQTYQEFMSALRPLSEEKGMKDLVLDLRGNPGGYINQCTDLLSQFFGDGKLLVYTKGRTESRRDYKSNGRARFQIENIAVLIDEGTASASEIVAGAIQDHDRGWVIGRRSFGKGLVQEQYDLQDGGALRLTVARYFTPSGRCIQRDYKHDNDYEGEPERRRETGELTNGQIHIEDSTQFLTGMGRVVFGGGGITPDVFVPLDTSYTNEYYYDMLEQLPRFVADWEGRNGAKFFSGTISEFVSGFQISDALFQDWATFAEKAGAKLKPDQRLKCQHELKLQLKSRLAKHLFGEEGQFAVLNDDDPAVEKALQILHSGQPVAKK